MAKKFKKVKKEIVQKKRITFFAKIGVFIKTHKRWFPVLLIFGLELFLRFYQIEERSPFGWDQVDNAWAANNFIINHHAPLVGMVAKGNSGFFIGPAYYYLISFFYWIFKLNPIASGIFAGVTSIFTFWVLFSITKKLFSFEVATIAVFINTVATAAIVFDRVQWPVDFIPSISLLIFYFLYKVIIGKPKFLLSLALALGFSFQIHFTSIFFPIIIVLTLPFFPRTKETIKYILFSLPLLLIWFIPNVIFELQQKSSQSSHLSSYLKIYYHGFHLRRVIQIIGDGLIQFEPYLFFPFLKMLKFILIPGFISLYLYKNVSRERILLCYLIILWFIVPWFVFATYSGEISDYYFAVNRFIGLSIISYFFGRLYMVKNWIPKFIVLIVLLSYGYINVVTYLSLQDTGLSKRRQTVLESIQKNQRIEYTEGVPESYLYYYYMRLKGQVVY